MQWWFILGFFMIVVGLPVIAGVWGESYKRRLRLKERELEIAAGQTTAQLSQHQEHTAQLERRVRVLEQIITDGGIHTAAQIEALRDLPSIGHTKDKVQ